MIELSEAGDVVVVTMNHGKVNAMDLEFCNALASTFRELASGPPRGVVLTGAGSAFSAGVDLWRVVEGGPAYVRQFVPALVNAFEALFFCPMPVVAAANGHAIAGGCVMVSSADYRLMTTARAGIGIPELVVGVPFPAGTFALTKRTLRSSVIQSGDLSEVMRIWEERSSDGWIRDYLERTVRRP